MNIEFRLDAKGIGDAICGVYTACGLADRGHIITFHAKHTEWLRWFDHPNLTIVAEQDPRVLNANEDYTGQLEMARLGKVKSRSLWYMRNIHAKYPVIRGEPQPARPLNIHRIGKNDDLPDDYILLAPFSAYGDREWSLHHWKMLARLLINEGHNVIAIGAAGSSTPLRDAFTNSGVRYFWGQSPEWTVKAIRNAKLTIGNDSGPAHVAGLYGAKAIALCGQIDGRFVYYHSPTVYPVLPPNHVPCAPCHWSKDAGWSNLCGQTCSALQLISPFEMAMLALQTIGEVNEGVVRKETGREANLSGPRISWLQQASSSPVGQRQEEDGASQEGRRSEAGAVRPEGLRGLHTAQGPQAQGELPQALGGDQRQIRKANKG